MYQYNPTAHITPELTDFIQARDRVNAALADQADALRRLKALNALDLAERTRVRRDTLIGVAPPASALNARAAFVAAALGSRPNGRY